MNGEEERCGDNLSGREKEMRAARLRAIVSVFIALPSLILLSWGAWPLGGEERTVQIELQDLQPMDAPGDSVAETEQRTLLLEWPSRMRVGDSGMIRLTLQAAQGDEQTASSQAPGLSARYNILCEAYLDVAGLDYVPRGQVTEALSPGRPVIFLWNVRPHSAGNFKSTVWLHVRSISRENGDEQRTVLSAQLIEIVALDFLGLSGKTARVVGSVGAVAGAVLGLDSALPLILKSLRRLQERPESE